jgi:glycosyltransferase involved in cell wall biosynthesis
MSGGSRICLLTLGGPDDADPRLAGLLAARGWDVHLLACGDRMAAAPAGVRCTHLDDHPETAEARVPEWSGDFDRRSLHALAAVKQLHAERPFDLIQYPDAGALGWRLAQAHRTGVGPAGALLVARVRGPSAWRRTQEARWMFGDGEPVLSFAEQTSVELAGACTGLSGYILREARALGWRVPADAPAVPDVPAPVPPLPPYPCDRIDEVAFGGPLDKLHGIRVFVRAAQALPPGVAVALVGPDMRVEDRWASKWAADRLKGRRVVYRDARSYEEIARLLAARNRVAVVPFLSAADAELVRRLCQLRVPFVTTAYGAVEELVPDPEARKHLVAEPTIPGVTATLRAYLEIPAATRAAWVERLAAAHSAEAVESAVVAAYERLLRQSRAARAAAPAAPARPKVTVGITHYNLGRFLPETLASVAAQTYPNLEVVIADDGSTDPHSVAVVGEMERAYPQFRFLRGPNLGVCGNRNRCLAAATGELFFPLDADNVAAPHMVETLVAAHQMQPDGVGAVSCFWLGFTDTDGLKAGRYAGSYRPSGGPRLTVGLWNPYGETSGLFRTALLRDLGGYDDLHPEYMSEDWHLYIKIAARGLAVAVVPEALYYYRVRADSRYRTGDHGVNHVRVLPDVAAIDLTGPERLELWTLVASLMHLNRELHAGQAAALQERDEARDRLRARRYRLADGLAWALRPLAWARRTARRVRDRLGRPSAMSPAAAE